MTTKVQVLDRMWVGTIAAVNFVNMPPQTPEAMAGFLLRLNQIGHPGMKWGKRSGSWILDEIDPAEITADAPGLVVDLRDTPDDVVNDRIVNGDLLDHPKWRVRVVLSDTRTYTIVDHSLGNAPTMLILADYMRKYIAGEDFAWKQAPVARYRDLLRPMALMFLSRKAKITRGIRTLRQSMATTSSADRGESSVSVSRHVYAVLPDSAFDEFTEWRKKETPPPSAALGVLVAFLRAARRSGLDLSDFVVEGSVDLTRYGPSMRRFGSNLIGYVSLGAGDVLDNQVSVTSVRWNDALKSGAPGIRVLLRSLRLLRKPGPFSLPTEARPSPAARRLAYSYIRFPGLVDEASEVPIITPTQFRVAPGCINVTTDPVEGGQIINVSYDETYVDGDQVRATLDLLVSSFIELLDEDMEG